MPTPKAVKRADGTLRWRVQFRETPGATPTSETFDTPEAAEVFIRAGEELGWAEARRVRHHGTTGHAAIPTLATWFETHLELLAASVTPGTVDGYRREARRRQPAPHWDDRRACTSRRRRRTPARLPGVRHG